MHLSNVIKVMTLTGVLIISTLLSACGSGVTILGITQGSGNLKTETRPVSGISTVQLDTSGELTLSPG